MSKTSAVFTPGGSDSVSDEGSAIPTGYAESLWAPGTLNGPAVCALAAHRVERRFGEDGFRPARFTIDMFKVAREVPTFTRGRLVRAGGRIRAAEIDVVQRTDPDPGSGSQDEVLVARATAVFLRPSQNPPGDRWQRPADAVTFRPPTEDIGDSDVMSRFSSEVAGPESEPVWNTDMGEHQNGRRKRLWSHPLPTIDGETTTPFVRAVTGAESTSLITNWGSTGIGFINCDLTVELARLPVGEWVGVEADSHIEHGGLSVGTAGLFDSHGMFGMGIVTAVNNAAAEIDFTSVDLTDRYREA